MDSDARLLSDYLSGSQTAFSKFVRRHAGLVYAAALRQVNGDAHLARDVAQIVFSEAARGAATLSAHPRIVGWLHTTTHFAAAKAVRSEVRRRDRERTAHALNLMNSDPDSVRPPDWEQLGPVLDAALLELDETDREAVLLRFLSNRSFREVGLALQLSEEAARKRVGRALDRLNASLSARGVPSSAAALALALADPAAVAVPPAVAGALASMPVGAAIKISTIMSTSKITAAVAAAAVIGLTAVTYRSATRSPAPVTPAPPAPAETRTAPERATPSPANSTDPAPPVAPAAAESRPPAADPTPSLSAAAPSAADPEKAPTGIGDFTNRGRATPSAGFQTAIWAAAKGDNDALDGSFQLVTTSQAKLQDLWTQLTDAERATLGRPERILSIFFAQDMLGSLLRLQILDTVSKVDPSETSLLKQHEALVAMMGGSEVAESRLALIRARAEVAGRNAGDPPRTGDRIFPMWLDGAEWKILVPDSLVPNLARIRAGAK